jgi:hypothetical protein
MAYLSNVPCSGTSLPSPAAQLSSRLFPSLPLTARQPRSWRVFYRANVARRPLTRIEAAGSTSGQADGLEQLSPLQQCLREAGFADVSFWTQTRFAKYATDAYVEGNLQPKLAELAAEGLRPHQGPGGEALEFLLQGPHNIIPCDFAKVFLINLKELQGVMSGFQLPGEGKRRSKKDLAGLSVVGQLIARQPAPLAGYLTSSPGSLTAQHAWLNMYLGLTVSEISRMIWHLPVFLNFSLGQDLLDLLQYLDSDELAGRAGWGRELLLREPNLVLPGTLERARQNVKVLRGAGCSREDIVALFEKRPDMFSKDLDGETFNCKFEWVVNESPWGLDVFFEAPAYLAADLARMASRLAFMRQHGLKLPKTPNLLACEPDKEFFRFVGKQLGRILTAEEWAAWVEGEWLSSEGGRRWGGRLQQKLDRAKAKGAVGLG